MAEYKDKDNTIEVETEEVNDFQEFKEKIKGKFVKRKQSKWQIAKGKIYAITTIAALASFLLIGFLTNTWHPTWLIFLVCPILPIFLSLFDGGKKQKIVAFVAVAVSAAYVLVGVLAHLWHPTWVAFFIIPITAILVGVDKD